MSENTAFDPKSKLSVIARRAQVRDFDMLIEKCSILYQILTVANEQVNLTRIDSEEGFWIKHVADSLMLGVAFPDLTRQKLRVGDIGCGAGFFSVPGKKCVLVYIVIHRFIPFYDTAPCDARGFF